MRKRGYAGYMNKKGGFTDLFLFMIFTIIIVFVSGIMIYIGITTEEALHENMGDIDLPSGQNASVLIDNSFDELNTSYTALYWISVLLIVGMMLSIFIGNYLVETKPVFFIPYFFIVIIAIVVAVGISIAYQQAIETPELATVFDGFVMANFIIAYLPLWMAGLGIVGGIIMFTTMGRSEQQYAFG